MSADINDSFIKQFEAEIHVAYQRMGSKLGNCTRKKTVKGSSTTFQKVGKGTAGQKTRHGNVPTMSIDHTPVEVTLADYYAADYIDKLDELKIQHDERNVVSTAIAGALGRKVDDLLITALETTTNSVASGAAGLATSASRTKVETVFEYFGNQDVPDDGERYFPVSPAGWLDLMTQDAFARMEYVGPDNLPFKGGMVAKTWLTFKFFQHSGLNKTSATRVSPVFHRSAIGHAVGQEVTGARFDWVPEKQAHLGVASLSMGAGLIDVTGTYKVSYDE
jgi:Phage capsid protein